MSHPLESLTIPAGGCWALNSGGQPWKARRHFLPHTVQLQPLLSQAQVLLCQHQRDGLSGRKGRWLEGQSWDWNLAWCTRCSCCRSHSCCRWTTCSRPCCSVCIRWASCKACSPSSYLLEATCWEAAGSGLAGSKWWLVPQPHRGTPYSCAPPPVHGPGGAGWLCVTCPSPVGALGALSPEPPSQQAASPPSPEAHRP